MATDSQLPRVILALDPGGSKCEALLVRDDGTVISSARAQQPGVSGPTVRAAVGSFGRLLANVLKSGWNWSQKVGLATVTRRRLIASRA